MARRTHDRVGQARWLGTDRGGRPRCDAGGPSGLRGPVEYGDLFNRIAAAYTGLIRVGGADPEFGAALPGLLLAGGLSGVGATAHVPFMFGGTDPHIARLTLEALGNAMVEMGLLTGAEIAEYLALSARPGMWQALVPCVSAWGRRPIDVSGQYS